MPKVTAIQRGNSSTLYTSSEAPVYDPNALRELESRGAHFLRCRPDKTPAESRGWQYRKASLDHLLAHVQDRGLVGVIPPSLKCAVLDVDTGDTDKMAINWPPMVAVPSRKTGRAHMWYRCDRPGANPKWATYFASGEVRAGLGGYVVLWQSADRLIADALARPTRSIDFEDVVQQLGLWTPEALDRAAPRRGPSQREVEKARRIVATGRKPSTGAILALEGHRHEAIKETLLKRAGHDEDLRGDSYRLAALAGQLNAQCSPPLPDREVAELAAWTAEVSRCWKQDGHTERFLSAQARRGTLSGKNVLRSFQPETRPSVRRALPEHQSRRSANSTA